MDKESIRKDLLRHYLINLIPGGALFALWALYKNLFGQPAPVAPDILGPAAFIAAIAAAVALPLLARARFVKAVGERTFVAPEPFLAFEKVIQTTALAAVYVAAVAYMCTVGVFHFGGAFLAALYAAYYYFPSEARVAHEMRLFRVRTGEDGGAGEG